MKEIFTFIILLLIGYQAFGQSKTLMDKTQKALNVYRIENDLDKLAELNDLIVEVFKDENASENAEAHYLKAQILTEQLLNDEYEIEDYRYFLEDIRIAYDKALLKDVRRSNRYFVLEKLYSAKAKLGEKGAKFYEAADYNTALGFYDSATYLNQLEIDYPRMIRPDTSTIYSNAVVAHLAKNSDRAIELFQKLVDMEYDRADAYDYLIRLYEAESYDVKAKKIRILKNMRFPEE